jgi:chemotaxis protein methyltransferase CheR
MSRPDGRDEECVAFLRWALPRLHLRWEGFRRVRRQVCRRIQRRVRALGLEDLEAYRAHLGAHPEEWSQLDPLCTASVSRFHRDRSVFEALARRVLPELAAACRASGRDRLCCWSAGCASGEEPYSVKILWELALAPAHPDLRLRILATDSDAALLSRAERARYRASSLRELPGAWRDAAFSRCDDSFELRPKFREGVELRRADLRDGAPDERFDLVLCRNLAFTYFDESLQRQALEQLARCLVPEGALVLGLHEGLPSGAPGFVPWDGLRAIQRRRDAPGVSFGKPR